MADVRPSTRGPRTGATSRFRAALVAAATASLLLGACASGAEEPAAGEFSSSASSLNQPWQVPATKLTDTDGSPYSLREGTDQPVTLVFFGYTNCPDICGMVMGNIASALARLDAEQREKIEVTFVTTDPARDDEKALRTYLDRYNEDFIGLTAPMKQILQAGDAFHVAIEKGEELPSGGYDVTHGTQIFLVDSEDEIPMFWGQNTSPAALADDLTTLLEANA